MSAGRLASCDDEGFVPALEHEPRPAISGKDLIRAIHRAAELADDGEPDTARRCRSFVAYLAGRISSHDPELCEVIVRRVLRTDEGRRKPPASRSA